MEILNSILQIGLDKVCCALKPVRTKKGTHIISTIAAVLAAVGAIFSAYFAWKTYIDLREDHFELYSEWITFFDAASSLRSDGEDAHSIYKTYDETLLEYKDGAALMIYYENQDGYAKSIKNLSVKIDDIVEDLSPCVNVISQLGTSDFAEIGLHNSGWGESGKVRISFQSVEPFPEYRYGTSGAIMPELLNVSVCEGCDTEWETPSLEPGASTSVRLFSLEDLIITYQGDGEGKVFSLRFIIEPENSDVTVFYDYPLIIRDGKAGFYTPGIGGGGGLRTYGIWIDATKETFSASYSVQQNLPGNERIQIPVFFLPSRSCTMTVRVQIEMSSGEVIEISPLKNAHFEVDYYDGSDYDHIYDGSLINWDEIDGNGYILNSPIQVQIGLPFVTIDNH